MGNTGMVKDPSDLDIAVVGVGGWGKNHARVLMDLGVLTAICDANAERAKEFAAKYHTCYYTSLDDMLREKILHGCIICTPTRTHFEVAKKIMEHGVNVFVEKPLAFSSAECEEMINISVNRKVLLTSGYIERFNPVVQDVKRIIKNKTYEDFATLMLGFEDHKAAIIASNWITPKKVRTFNAVCTEGIISGDFITQEIHIDEAERTITPRRTGALLEPLTLELKSFIGALQGKADESLISATDATNVTKVAESAILSSKTGSPIYLELK